MFQLSDGHSGRRRPVGVAAGAGRYAVCQRRPGQTAIGKRCDVLAKEDIRRYGIAARLELAAAGVLVFLDFPGINLAGFTSDDIDDVIVIAEPRRILHDPLDLLVAAYIATAGGCRSRSRTLLQIFLQFIDVDAAFSR